MVAIVVGERDCRTQFCKRTIQWLFHQSLVLIEVLVPDKMFVCEFPIGSYVKLRSAVQPSWWEGGTNKHNFGRGSSNDYFIKVWFQTRRFLCEFPIGSYVKLSSAIGGHLGRRAEPPDLFLEKNHPMIISSTFSSYWTNGFKQEDFYGNFP